LELAESKEAIIALLALKLQGGANLSLASSAPLSWYPTRRIERIHGAASTSYTTPLCLDMAAKKKRIIENGKIQMTTKPESKSNTVK